MADASGSWINPLISGAAGLLGVAIGSLLSVYADRKRRRAEFWDRQLKEFYGPLLGLRPAIRAHSDLRVKLQDAGNESWNKLVATARVDGGPFALQRLRESDIGKRYSAMIDAEGENFRDILMPWYRQMIEVFRNNISLAEPETRKHFPALIEFVEVWSRYLEGKLPGQVAQAMGHGEANLHPLYANIEETHDRLRRQLSGQ